MLLFELLLSFSAVCGVSMVNVDIDTRSVLREIDPHFLSVTIDTGLLKRHWENLDMR